MTDLNRDLRDTVEFARLVLLEGGLVVFLPVCNVDALADVPGCFAYFSLRVACICLEDLRPRVFSLCSEEHSAGKVNRGTRNSRWNPLVHGSLEQGNLSKVA